MRFSFLVLLICTSVVAEGGSLSRGDLFKDRQYRTNADVNLFVNFTGNNANSCTTASLPCLTIQGALNKLPRVLRHKVTVNVAAGTYPDGFYISGFVFDESFQRLTMGLNIIGAGFANSTTLASGTATGTVSSGTTGSSTLPTFGTLTDLTQNWTVNDLKGRWLLRTGGTGVSLTSTYIIESNTATTITIVSSQTAIDATSTYAIQDPLTTVTGLLPFIAVNGTLIANWAAVHISGNIGKGSPGSLISILNIRFAPTLSASFIFDVRSSVGVRFDHVHVDASSPAAMVNVEDQAAYVNLRHCYLNGSFSSTPGIHLRGVVTSRGSTLLVQRTLIVGINEGIFSFGDIVGFQNSEVSAPKPFRLQSGLIWKGGFYGSKLIGSGVSSCLNFAEVGVSNSIDTNTGGMGGYIDNVEVSGCTNAVASHGGSAVITAISGTSTNGLVAFGGGRIHFVPVGFTLVASGSEVSIDNAATSTVVGLGSGCLAGLGSGSRICTQ